MRRLSAILASALLAAPASADDVVWRPAEPLHEPGPVAPAAKLGPLVPQSRPAPEGTARPHELPGTVTEPIGPSLPPRPAKPVIVIPVPEPARRVAKEQFASDGFAPAALPAAPPIPAPKPGPKKPFVPAKVSVQPARPQPWAPRPGQRTIISDFFAPTR